MDLRVLRIAHSTNVERVALALAHKGLEAHWIDVAHDDRAAVLGTSGQPLVPVLLAGDEVIPDSTAILGWLEERFPEPALWPRAPAERALTDVAIAWFNGVWKVAPNAIAAELAAPAPDSGAITAAAAELRGTLPWFEALLDGRDFLLGEALGALDLIAFPFVKYGLLAPAPEDRDPFHMVLHEHLALAGRFPHLERWIRRIDHLPRA